MRIYEIDKKARALGIRDTWKFSKKELIRTIQLKEGNTDCYGRAKGVCSWASCCWRGDCLK